MTGLSAWRQSWRWLWRDWRSGALRLMALGVVLAVAAVSSVAFLAQRVEEGMRQHAAELLGGDAAMDSDHPIHATTLPGAQPLRSVDIATLASMAVNDRDDTRMALVAVKAVSPAYPLVGDLLVLPSGEGLARPATAPQPGHAWIDPGVRDALGLQPGDQLRLGRLRLVIDGDIQREPDRRLQMTLLAPRVLIRADDLAASGLVQPGSRVSYRTAVAGPRQSVKDWVNANRATLLRGQKIEDAADPGSQSGQTIREKLLQFLSICSAVTLLISAIGIAATANRHALRRQGTIAVLRCLGLTQSEVTAILYRQFAILGILASALGVLGGYWLQRGLVLLLGGIAGTTLEAPGWKPVFLGMVAGLFMLFAFTLPALERLRVVSPGRVLRSDLAGSAPRRWRLQVPGVAGTLCLMVWICADWRQGLILAGGLGLAVVLLGAAVWTLVVFPLRWLRAHVDALAPSVRFALAAMLRRPAGIMTQVIALAAGLMALLFLAVVRGDLIDQWQSRLPAGAPDHFLINIQPGQVAAVREALAGAGIDRPAVEPMIRGRLVRIDDRDVHSADYDDEQTRNLVEREFNLSSADGLPAGNRIVQGRWQDERPGELSIEEGIARRLGVRTGQTLTFEIEGEAVSARVTSVRQLDWDSMRVNFFVILSPELLRDRVGTYITAVQVPAAAQASLTSLVRRFPNLTVIDVREALAQLRSLLDDVIHATQLLFLLALAAGWFVLAAALAATQDERRREAAILRALGASSSQLRLALWVEMSLIGLVAGGLAVAVDEAVLGVLARRLLEVDFRMPALAAALCLIAALLGALTSGWLALRGVLRSAPLQSLRSEP